MGKYSQTNIFQRFQELGPRNVRVAGSIPTQGEIKKKRGCILSSDSEVTLSHWSRSIELVIMPLIDL
jgi:hypothetical protein